MMRLMFALLVTLAGFVAASLWLARDAGPESASERARRGGDRTIDLGAIASSVLAEIPATAPPPEVAADEMPVAGPPAVREASPGRREAKEVVEAEIPATASAAFVEDPVPVALSAQPVPAEAVPDAAPSPPHAPAGTLDQDEWAALIRRMLALYTRTGHGE